MIDRKEKALTEVRAFMLYVIMQKQYNPKQVLRQVKYRGIFQDLQISHKQDVNTSLLMDIFNSPSLKIKQ